MNQSENKTVEYKGECFDTIEGAWDWHSRAIPETAYSPDDLEYLMGEEIMFKRDFEPAVRQLLNLRTASLIQTIENRVKELEAHQSEFKPTSNTYQELGYIIIELRNLLKLIKS